MGEGQNGREWAVSSAPKILLLQTEVEKSQKCLNQMS